MHDFDEFQDATQDAPQAEPLATEVGRQHDTPPDDHDDSQDDSPDDSPEPITPDDAPPEPPAKLKAFDEANLRLFLSHIVDPARGATEFRILNGQYQNASMIVPNTKFSTTLSAWYDNVESLVKDARKLRQVSAYICLNPTTPDLLGRSYNQLSKVRNATTDDDIVCLRWFYIDVDPVRPADISATFDELTRAIERRDTILRDHPDIARVSLTGLSGNGAFIMARMPDYPNDAEHRQLVADALDSITSRYSDGLVKIDVKTKNPSRVGCVPGTLKCKGSHIPARPWKMAVLEGTPEGWTPGVSDGPPPTLDLREWLGRNPAPVVVQPIRPSVAHQGRASAPWGDRAQLLRRAAAYADRMPEAVSGAGGHDATFNVACAMVNGFDLTIDEARGILYGYNARCSPPWEPHEIEHKLSQAEKSPHKNPRGYLADANREDYARAYTGPGADFIIGQPIPQVGQPVPHGGQPTPHVGHPIPHGPLSRPPAHPATAPSIEAVNARAKILGGGLVEDLYRDKAFLAALAHVEGVDPGEGVAIESVLKKAHGFTAAAFNKAMKPHRDLVANPPRPPVTGGPLPFAVPEGLPEFRPTDMGNAELFAFMHAKEARYVKAYGAWMIYDGARWKEDEENVTSQWAQQVPGLIGAQIRPDMADETIEAITSWQSKSESTERLAAVLKVAMANLTTTPATFDKDHMMFNCQNGTIDLRTGEFREHRPGDFLTKISPVVYDPSATCPMWEKLMLEVMKDDPETVAYIRRIMGYSMTGVVKDHAVFICYGHGSNGKTLVTSTCIRVLGDYATDLDPEILMSQANAMHPTGLTDLEGRRLVVCEETDDRRGLAEAIIKRITGGAKIRARKIGKDYYDFEPTHHIFMCTNHLPTISGSDHGIWRRLKLIPFEVQFDEKSGRPPDRDLPVKLQAEYSGILNWMLRGLKDWQANGLMDSPAITKATNAFREDSDTLGWYLSENTVDYRKGPEMAREGRQGDPMTLFKSLYEDYKDWAEGNGVKPMGSKKLGAQLNDRGFLTWKSGNKTFKRGLKLVVSMGCVLPDGGGDDGPGGSPVGGPGDDGDDGGSAVHQGWLPDGPDGDPGGSDEHPGGSSAWTDARVDYAAQLVGVGSDDGEVWDADRE